jgi:hypothetical protein
MKLLKLWQLLAYFILPRIFGQVVNITALKQYCRNHHPYIEWDDTRTTCWVANQTMWNLDHHMLQSKAQAIELARLHAPSTYSEYADKFVGTYVYIHAFTLKDQIGGYLILDKLLESMRTSGLLTEAALIYVVMTGYFTNVQVDELLSQYPRSKVKLIEIENNDYFEFPTLAIMQEHARTLHPLSRLLYMHTKGVTKFHENRERKIMIYFHISLFKEKLKLLDAGWDTVGIITIFDQEIHYFNGNFFWTKPRYILNTLNVTDLVWDWRYGAERWIMSNISLSCRVFHSNYTHGLHVQLYGEDEDNSAVVHTDYMTVSQPVHPQCP